MPKKKATGKRRSVAKKPDAKPTYQAAKFTTWNRSKVQEYGEELIRLEQLHGGLKPKDVVNAAEDEDSILHDIFEWKDDTAAHNWRILQARNFIREVEIEIVFTGTDAPHEVEFVVARAMHNVVDEEGDHQYISFQTMKDSPSYRQQVIGQIRSELLRLVEKLRMFEELHPQCKKLETLIKDIADTVADAPQPAKSTPVRQKRQTRKTRHRQPCLV